MLFLLASALLVAIAATSADDQKTEIHTEIETLADDLNDLLKTIESLDKGDFADENIFHEIVDKIQDLAEATEEENLIKLAETVKNKRMKEEQLQSSLVNLETLSDELEKITVSADSDSDKDSKIAEILEFVTKANLEDEENIFSEDDHDDEINKNLDGIKNDMEQLIKFVK